MISRDELKSKKRIVIKIGSSSLTHPSGDPDLLKLEKLVRVLTDLHNQGKEVILVSSGAIAVGRKEMGMKRPTRLPEKQALAAIGQAKLMMIYQKLFAEYGQRTAQILMTKDTVVTPLSRYNARNTIEELLHMGVIPVVNENDTISTYEIQFGDNDHLSAIVSALIKADLLILLSDIDGLYTDDPRTNLNAVLVPIVEELDDNLMQMGKDSSSSDVGTGGMAAKLDAAKIAIYCGTDMIIANGDNVEHIAQIMNGQEIGTLFLAHKKESFDFVEYIN